MKSLLIVTYVLATAFCLPNDRTTNRLHVSYQKDMEVSPSSDARIVNGKPADRDQFPYQISLQWRFLVSSSHVCGGSIISKTTAVTAGHCIQSYGTHIVIAGILKMNEEVESAQSHTVSKIISHPNWPGGNQVSPWDISILKLASPFVWNKSVQPVNLPKQGASFIGKAVLSGWGLTASSGIGNSPKNLQYAEKSLITTNECAAALTKLIGNAGPLDDSMICTSGAKKISACNGDSGGPLVKNNKLIGIVSWGLTPCGTENAPSVFTRTSHYVDWIHDNE